MNVSMQPQLVTDYVGSLVGFIAFQYLTVLSLLFGCCSKVSEGKSAATDSSQEFADYTSAHAHTHTKHPSTAAAACPISTARLLHEKNRKISQSKHGWSCHGNLTAPSRFLCFCHFLYPLCLLFSRLGQQLPSSQHTAGLKLYHPSATMLSFFSSISHERKQPCKALLVKLHPQTGTIWSKHGFRLADAHLGQKHLFPLWVWR